VSTDALGELCTCPLGEYFRPGCGSTPVAVCGEPVTSDPDGERKTPTTALTACVKHSAGARRRERVTGRDPGHVRGSRRVGPSGDQA
jgi:hypothetical protein